MQVSEYQVEAHKFAIYPKIAIVNDDGSITNTIPAYPLIGLSGEVGELAEKIKKIIRDKNGEIDYKNIDDIRKEIGDVLWYLCEVATSFHIDMNTVASENIYKLRSRQERGKLSGSGDNR